MRDYWRRWTALTEEERQELRDLQDAQPPYHGKTMGELLDEKQAARNNGEKARASAEDAQAAKGTGAS